MFGVFRPSAWLAVQDINHSVGDVDTVDIVPRSDGATVTVCPVLVTGVPPALIVQLNVVPVGNVMFEPAVRVNVSVRLVTAYLVPEGLP